MASHHRCDVVGVTSSASATRFGRDREAIAHLSAFDVLPLHQMLYKTSPSRASENSRQMVYNRPVSAILFTLGVLALPAPALAQRAIVPDDTLGEERSRVVPDSSGVADDLIVGGARRAQNLFHSFDAFSIEEGRRVFFASPSGLEAIFSRVTGGSPSEIFGTLGVNGPADLYFLNPNGIVFGENASLDMAGSFVGSTASSVIFSDGVEFSAAAPAAESLLTMSVPLGLQYGPTAAGSTLVHQGSLQTGQDLSLAADRLNLEGSLRAGEDLVLQAADTLTIRDSATAPFTAVADGDMVLQGDGSVDIFALTHPASGLAAGGDLTLRSSTPVIGDAHYWSGGDFRIETITGGLGALTSPNDPVLRVAGDVTFDSYSGASLHIIAGGSVTVPGTIEITGADPVNGLVDAVSLSDGSSVAVNGQTRPTLDIRAGTLAVGAPGATGDTAGFVPAAPATGTAATSADIAIGGITTANNGLVLLTNQVEPNAALPGGTITLGAVTAQSGLGGESLVVDARDSITATGDINVSTPGVGSAGDIVLLAENGITLDGITVLSEANGASVAGGDIDISSATLAVLDDSFLSTRVPRNASGDAGDITITTTESVLFNDDSDINSTVGPNAVGNGGNIEITTGTLELLDGSNLFTSTNGQGNAGNVTLSATESVRLSDSDFFSSSNGGAVGDAGTIQITTEALEIVDDTDLLVNSSGDGNAGNILIDAATVEVRDRSDLRALIEGPEDGSVVTADGGSVIINASESVVFDEDSDININIEAGVDGDGGVIEITTGTLEMLDDSEMFADTDGQGDAGDITIDATESVLLDNSDIRSSVNDDDAVGEGGDIQITTGSFQMLNDSDINADTEGTGDAGNIIINATTFEARNRSDLRAVTEGMGNSGSIIINATESAVFAEDSDAISTVLRNAVGDGGTVQITTGNLQLLQDSELIASTGGEGDAGNVIITATDSVLLDDSNLFARVGGSATGDGGTIDITTGSFQILNNSDIIAESNGMGDAGSIIINAVTFEARDRSDLRAFTSGDGDGGDIFVTATESVLFDEDSDVISLITQTAVGDGGNIQITTGQLTFLDDSEILASTNGIGDAGDIVIVASESAFLDDSNFISRVNNPNAIGEGGSIEITTGSFEMVNNSELSVNTVGTGNAGSITLNLTSFISRDSNLEAFTEGNGDAGNIVIDASGAVLFLDDSDVSNVVLIDGVGNSGNIEITGETVEFREDSNPRASTVGEGNAGNILIIAIDSVRLDDSDFFSIVNEGAVGNAGGITITTDTLEATNGSELFVNTNGTGNAGSIIITASDSVVLAQDSDLTANVSEGAVGNGGSIIVTTGTLELFGDSELFASTSGEGDAGDIIVTATERVTFNGSNADGPFPTDPATDGSDEDLFTESSALSQVDETGVGDGGDIEITAPVLEVLGGAVLTASTLGDGDAGNVIINASDRVIVTGISGDGDLSSSMATFVAETGSGDGGSISITAPVVRVTNGGQLTASTSGEGDAGGVIIDASDRVVFSGTNGEFISGASSQVEVSGVGSGGDIDITAPVLRVLGGAQLAASTLGQGGAGDVVIEASDRVVLAGAGDGGEVSTIASLVAASGDGDGGNVSVTAPVLRVIGGGQLTASTSGDGDAGRVVINAGDRLILDGVSDQGFSSGIFTVTTTEAEGEGGSIRLNAPTLRVSNGAVVNARTENDDSGGSVRIDANTISLLDGGQVITTTLGAGPAGNIVILDADSIRLSGSDGSFAARRDAFPDNVINEGNGQSGLFANTRSDATGDGGNINADADTLSLSDGAIISAQSEGSGPGGSVVLDIAESVQLDGSDITAAATEGTGGDIRVTTTALSLSNRATISAQSDGSGTAGGIVLNASESLQLTDSDITTSARQSSGGDIRINTSPDSQDSVTVMAGDGDITTNSQGDGGNITIRGAVIIAFDDSDIVSRSDDARGGNITLSSFFSDPIPPGSADDFDGNAQVDLNASGAIASGTITTPDTSFIQNSLASLPEGIINTESLIANSCVVRNEDGSSTFVVTGADGLPERPGETAAFYSTGDIQTVPEANDSSWQPGDPIIEPQGMYRLQNGELVLSHRCE